MPGAYCRVCSLNLRLQVVMHVSITSDWRASNLLSDEIWCFYDTYCKDFCTTERKRDSRSSLMFQDVKLGSLQPPEIDAAPPVSD